MYFSIISFVILSLGLCNAGVVPRDFILRKNELTSSSSKSTHLNESIGVEESSPTFNVRVNSTQTLDKTNVSTIPDEESSPTLNGRVNFTRTLDKTNVSTIPDEESSPTFNLRVNSTRALDKTNVSTIPDDAANTVSENDIRGGFERRDLNESNVNTFQEHAVMERTPIEGHQNTSEVEKNQTAVGLSVDTTLIPADPVLETNHSFRNSNASNSAESTVGERNSSLETESVEIFTDSTDIFNQTVESNFSMNKDILHKSSVFDEPVGKEKIPVQKDLLNGTSDFEGIFAEVNSSFKISSRNGENNKSEVSNQTGTSSIEHIWDNSSISDDPIKETNFMDKVHVSNISMKSIFDVFNSTLETALNNTEHHKSSENVEQDNAEHDSSENINETIAFKNEFSDLQNISVVDDILSTNTSVKNIANSNHADEFTEGHDADFLDLEHNGTLEIPDEISNVLNDTISSNNSHLVFTAELILDVGTELNNSSENSSLNFMEVIKEPRNNTDSVEQINGDKSSSEGIFSNTPFDFLLKSDVAKNAAMAMEIFNFSDSLTDHIIEENEFHSFLDAAPSAQENNPVFQEPSTANTSGNERLSETSEIANKQNRTVQFQLKNESSEVINISKDKIENELPKGVDGSTFSFHESGPFKNGSGERFDGQNVSHLSDVNVDVDTVDLETANVNSTSDNEPKCPPPGWCIFSFLAQDACAEDSHCLGSRICCRIRCSKTCIEVNQ